MDGKPCITDTEAYAVAAGLRRERASVAPAEPHALAPALIADLATIAARLRGLADHYTTGRAVGLFAELAGYVEDARDSLPRYLELADEDEDEAARDAYGDDSRYDRECEQ